MVMVASLEEVSSEDSSRCRGTLSVVNTVGIADRMPLLLGFEFVLARVYRGNLTNGTYPFFALFDSVSLNLKGVSILHV